MIEAQERKTHMLRVVALRTDVTSPFLSWEDVGVTTDRSDKVTSATATGGCLLSALHMEH